MPLIIDAIKKKRYKKIQLALQLGWNLNERDPEQLRTPLIELTFLDREAIATRLCKRFLIAGARLDLKDVSGRNALHWACINGREKLVEIFVNEVVNKFDLNAQDNNGNTALSLAVISGNENIVRKLIKTLTRYQLSVDVANNNGETPLILASKTRSYFLCEILKKVGRASTEMRDKIRQLNAKEWESVSEDVEQGVSWKHDTNNKPVIQEFRTDKISLERPRSEGNYHKREIHKIFSLYYDELSPSFRPPAIPPTKVEESEQSQSPAICYENDGDYSDFTLMGGLTTCPVSPSRGRRRFTISKAAQIPLTVNRMRRTNNTLSERRQNSWIQGSDEYVQSSGKRLVLPKFDEVNTIVPVVKRSSCPILRQRRTINSKDEMGALRLETLSEDTEQT